MIKFIAHKVPVLVFSRTPDRQDQIIPPEAFAKLKAETPVVFQDGGETNQVGIAKLYREKDELLADIEVVSTMPSRQKAMELMQKLYPYTIFKVVDAHEDTILKFIVTALGLSPGGNADKKVLPLGHRIRFKDAKEMH